MTVSIRFSPGAVVAGAACLFIGLQALAAGGAAAQSGQANDPVAIRMTFGDVTVTGQLNSTPAARDLVRQLPVTVPMSRLANREYAGRWPLSADGPRQQGYADGDIGYWAPGGYLAVFFDLGGEAEISDVIVMGTVTSDLSALQGLGSTYEVRIELSDGASAPQ